jgi:hypothetical protein
MKKTLQRFLADPRVEEISDESRGGDGYWLYLAPGWQRGDIAPSLDAPVKHANGRVTGGACSNEHQVHEWNMRDLTRAMRHEVFPCGCWDCSARKAEGS